MSSLAAARADNMYYPPEWTPEMGSVSKFQGSKGSNQYEQNGVIRFELPVHGWCLGCQRHLGRGTRFNAKKDLAGKYFTTKIWQFSMKCPSCSNVMVIRTDPKNTDYEYVEGIRKKETAFDAEEVQTERVQDDDVSAKLAVDPLFRLEHEQEDKRRAATRKTALTRLTELSEAQWGDDYSANANLRRTMRSRRKTEKEREREAKASHLALAKGLGIHLASPSPTDDISAGKIRYRSKYTGFRRSEREKMASISGESIFGKESQEQARKQALLVKGARRGIKIKGMRVMDGLGSGTSSRVPVGLSGGKVAEGAARVDGREGRSVGVMGPLVAMGQRKKRKEVDNTSAVDVGVGEGGLAAIANMY
ncbi:unnamed protein product [Choristocarpus tenellus]